MSDRVLMILLILLIFLFLTFVGISLYNERRKR